MGGTEEFQVLTANGKFATDMYNLLSKKEGNVIFSPLSAHAALSMVYQGARGTTKDAMTKGLNLSNPETAAKGYSVVMDKLNNAEKVTLSIANKVYVQKKYNMHPDFQTAVTKKFQSEVETVDFAKNVEAVDNINEWVSKKTKEKIQNLFNHGDCNQDTRLVLVNAIYFKGNWEHKFQASITSTEPFYLDEVNKVDCKMMHLSPKSFLYKLDEELKAQILQMRYENHDYSMVIILPREKNGIANLEAQLAKRDLSKITEGLTTNLVKVSLPKFKIEQTMNLEQVLGQLGLGEMFEDGRANFTGMMVDENENVEPLVVSKVVQKAFLEVNEQGSEAAAATGIIGMHSFGSARPIQPRPKIFKADHPFFYVITSTSTTEGVSSSLIFMGAFKNPKALSKENFKC